jgi:hypothetical protein
MAAKVHCDPCSHSDRTPSDNHGVWPVNALDGGYGAFFSVKNVNHRMMKVNMLKVYRLDDISYQHFKDKHVMTNTPCIIKGFINDNNCPKETLLKGLPEKEMSVLKIGPYDAYRSKYTKLCKNHIVNGVEDDQSMEVCNTLRLWKHDKGAFTPWHYDGNGADLFNVSLKGSKIFYLAPPDKFPVYPLSNVALTYPFKETSNVHLLPGDMLYIPAYWFHKVITIEDATMNMNYVFFNKNFDPSLARGRNGQIYTLHKALKTHMCTEDPICEIMGGHSYLAAGLRGMIETLPCFIIYLIILLCLPHGSYFRLLWTVIVITFLLYLTFSSYVDEIYFGIVRLVSFFTLAWIFIYLLVAYSGLLPNPLCPVDRVRQKMRRQENTVPAALA